MTNFVTKKPVQDCQRLISNIEERARPATMSKRAIRSCSDDITDTSVQQFYKFGYLVRTDFVKNVVYTAIIVVYNVL